MFDLLLWPFIACVVLTGIHAYLGMHVIKRGVIFVDLALAQTAGLGTLVGFAAGIAMHTTGSYLISLSFALAGALFFAWARSLEKIVPQEAVIGITYVFAAAAAVLILSKAPSEAEHIKDMLVGNILFVKPAEVIKTAVLYSVIGIFHFIFRKKFWLVTDDCDEACREKVNIPFWDFLFYATFGAVVTSSVEIAGSIARVFLPDNPGNMLDDAGKKPEEQAVYFMGSRHCGQPGRYGAVGIYGPSDGRVCGCRVRGHVCIVPCGKIINNKRK